MPIKRVKYTSQDLYVHIEHRPLYGQMDETDPHVRGYGPSMSTDNIQCILEKPKEAVPYVLGLTSPLHVPEA
jgi:hypothetical protein